MSGASLGPGPSLGPGLGPGLGPRLDGAAARGSARALVDVALGGALGTLIRVGLVVPGALVLTAGAAALEAPVRDAVALLAVNLVGAAALGALVGWRHVSARVARWWPAVATGLLGGLTTFSSMVVAAGRLGHGLGLVDAASGRMGAAGLAVSAAYLLGSTGLGVGAYAAAQRSVERRSMPRGAR